VKTKLDLTKVYMSASRCEDSPAESCAGVPNIEESRGSPKAQRTSSWRVSSHRPIWSFQLAGPRIRAYMSYGSASMSGPNNGGTVAVIADTQL
jgi:hypothetical protein